MNGESGESFSPSGYWLYLRERFPPVMNVFAIFLLYSCTLLAASRIQGFPVPALLPYVAGFIWALGVFYHLRVLDDLKDREADIRAFPERVLSRGILTYRQLAVTGIVAIAVETALAAWLGPKILYMHFLTLGYSLLMFKEFFIRDWLKRHLFWYGISHMLILACIDFTILQMSLATGPLVRVPGFILFAFLGFCMTFSLEVSRKIRVREVERPEVDTYSKTIGIGGSLTLAAGFQALVMVLAWLIRRDLGTPPWFHLTTLIVWLVVVAVFLQWGRMLTDARSRKLDKVASLFYLQFYLSLLGVLLWRK